jgi:signal transduction histidine kinase/FixJ family two-component response regulator
MLNQLKLGPKFTLLLSIVFATGILLSGITLWFITQNHAEEEVTAQVEVLTQTMNAVRSYTSNHIEPLLQSKLQTESEFVREIVPSFSARTVFEEFRNRPEYKSFFYKEATPNPTNPENRADEFEENLFAGFRASPDLKVLSGYRTLAGKRLYYTARPLAIRQTSCLDCHSTPNRAPKSQIATYGDQSGFGWQLNDLIAIQMIYVPVGEVIEHNWRLLSLVMGIFSTLLAIAILLINRLLKFHIVQPIKRLNRIARYLSQDSITPEHVRKFETHPIAEVAKQHDEPGQLAHTFLLMAREVADRETKLNQAVEDRTAQLAERTNEAQAANRAKSRFLANMSHELRTPLNIILGFSQLMSRQRSLDTTQQRYIETINHSGEHLLGLINNVLDLAKIEAGKITLNKTNFDLYGMLNGLQAMFQLEAEVKGIRYTIERTNALPHRICTDEAKLRQVLMNLVSNAIKFTSTGQVNLRATVDRDDELQFEVEDTGIGIASAELKKLFQPFVQTASGRKAQEGTGLGLAIAHQFVQLMGGTLDVESQMGSGTTFRFSINAPFTETPSLQSYITRQVIGLAPGQPTYRILVVDDIAENRMLLMELLQPIGFEVQQARHGQEAIAICQSWLPHLIWMDIWMPEMDGHAATRQIKASITPAPVVIALTGSAFEVDYSNVSDQGFNDFVRKPFRAEIIFEKMATHLGIRYSYAISEAKKEVQTLSQELSIEDLSTMPMDWIEQLHQAATRVNAKDIFMLIDRIPAEKASLIQALTQRVNNFRFAEIKTIAEQV